MPRPSIVHRMLVVACSAWIALNGAVRGASSGCAMHDGSGRASHAGMAHGPTRPSPPASHTAGATHRHADPAPDAPALPEPCSCVGDCCGVAPVSFVRPAPHVVAAAVVVVQVVRPLDRTAVARARSHVLPFANGPPVARTA